MSKSNISKDNSSGKIKTILTRGTMAVIFTDSKGKIKEEAVKFGIECGSKNAALLKPGVIFLNRNPTSKYLWIINYSL